MKKRKKKKLKKRLPKNRGFLSYMKQITREMLKIYVPISNLDWMNYRIVRKSDLTYHHIIKKCEGGKETIWNGALLMPVSHQYLHLIENKEIKTYIAINEIFKFINNQRREPTEEQRDIIEYLLKEFERNHEGDRSSKNKVLIKEEYLYRGYRK